MIKNRIKCVKVSSDFLTQIFTRGNKSTAWECLQGLPQGAEYIDQWREGDAIYLTFAHESFEEVELGAMPPVLLVFYKKIYHE